VLAELLELAPGGVEERDDGDVVEYAVYGAPGELPALPDLRAAAGGALVDVSTTEIEDDWSERWREFHQPVTVGGRVHVRAPWHPPAAAGSALAEVVIDPGQAFGTGAHASTRLTLELLTRLEPAGPLADWGCGSGVLAVCAAKLGWAPVLACDVEPESVAATVEDALANGVTVEVSRCDVRQGGPPAPTVLANLVRPLLLEVAVGMTEVPHRLIISGLEGDEPDEVVPAFERRGLVETRRRTGNNWSAIELIDSRR